MADYQIIIERESALLGCALKHSVELDGFAVGTLKNGQYLIINTTTGNHTISFIVRGKVEKTLPLFIDSEDYITRILVRLNAWGKLEISKAVKDGEDYNSYIEQPVPKRRKTGVTKTAGAILVLFFLFFTFKMLFSIGNDNPSWNPVVDSSEDPEVVEPTNEEQAAAQLEKATEKFQSGDYISAIELCNDIVSSYPDTEVATGISAYLDEQFAQYPHYSATDLMSEYDANIVNADELYTGNVLVITGTVSNIGKTNGDTNLTVMLKTGTYFYGVQLNFKTSQSESVAELREGDTVTAIGKCTGKSGKQLIVFDGNNVMIENCYLIG